MIGKFFSLHETELVVWLLWLMTLNVLFLDFTRVHQREDYVAYVIDPCQQDLVMLEWVILLLNQLAVLEWSTCKGKINANSWPLLSKGARMLQWWEHLLHTNDLTWVWFPESASLLLYASLLTRGSRFIRVRVENEGQVWGWGSRVKVKGEGQG